MMKKAAPAVGPKPFKAPGSTTATTHYTGLPVYKPVVYKNPELEELPPPPAELMKADSRQAQPLQTQQQKLQSKPLTAKASNAEEDEVDQLTSLLMQSMDAASDPNFYGICAICGQKVLGDENGCTALDKFYHVACFVCSACRTPLKDKPFFLTDNQYKCEPCYMKTLEVCLRCDEPITNRLLRAHGAAYHPRCFLCHGCDRGLDDVPFTLDPSGSKPHCIDCYNRLFGPRCSACKQPILPSPGEQESVRVVALDREFHIKCFKCEDCCRLLSSEEEGSGCYPLDGHLLCKMCNAHRIQRIS